MQSEAGAPTDNASNPSHINGDIHRNTQSAETSNCDNRQNNVEDEEAELPSYSEAVLSISSNSYVIIHNGDSSNTPVSSEDSHQVNHAPVPHNNAPLGYTAALRSNSSSIYSTSGSTQVDSSVSNIDGSTLAAESTSESSTASEVSTDTNCVTETESDEDSLAP